MEAIGASQQLSALNPDDILGQDAWILRPGKEVSGKTDFMDFVRSARNRNPPPEPAKDAIANDLRTVAVFLLRIHEHKRRV